MPMASTTSGIHRCGSVRVALTREFFIFVAASYTGYRANTRTEIRRTIFDRMNRMYGMRRTEECFAGLATLYLTILFILFILSSLPASS
jgi:hypothetical protein